jgi:hypothetical protein
MYNETMFSRERVFNALVRLADDIYHNEDTPFLTAKVLDTIEGFGMNVDTIRTRFGLSPEGFPL